MHSRLKILVAEKEAREGRRIKQTEIATVTGLNPLTIRKYMGPEPFSRVEAEAVEQLCKWLDCGIGDLLYFERSPN